MTHEKLIERVNIWLRKNEENEGFSWAMEIIRDCKVALQSPEPESIWKKYPEEKPDTDRYVIVKEKEHFYSCRYSSNANMFVTSSGYVLSKADYWCYAKDLLTTIQTQEK
jgi:hypothetical protein